MQQRMAGLAAGADSRPPWLQQQKQPDQDFSRVRISTKFNLSALLQGPPILLPSFEKVAGVCS